ncbi:PepSY-associated TM helix domain-containing protein [Phormidesmis priestleyi]
MRNVVFSVHRYIGIFAGVILCIVGITGSLLVFEAELDRTLQPYPIIPQSNLLSHQVLVNAAQKARPDLKPHRVTLPPSPDQPYTVMMVDAQDQYTDVFINPYSGVVLGTKPWKQTLGGWLIDLHVHLFAGDWGGQIVGISGVSLLALGITGVILWTGWRKLKIGFQIRWNSRWQILNYDLHNVGGILSALLLSLIAFTGAAMVYWTPFEAGARWLTQTTAPPEVISKVLPSAVPMNPDALLFIAQNRLPNARFYKFYPAKTPESPFKVWMQFPQESAFTKDAWIDLEQYTGAVLKLQDARKATIVDRILNAQYTIHVGHYGGIITQLLYAIVGIAPLGLFLTGFIIWWSRTYGAKTKRKQVKE